MTTTNNGGRSRLQGAATKSGSIEFSVKVPTLSVPSSKSSSVSRSPSRASQANKFSAPTSLTDATNDKATASLIRRVLCPQSNNHGSDQRESGTPRSLEELLPPLTSSNEVDLQLYALIAIIIKEFVNVWYSKITTDHNFTDEVIQIIAHCTRALEQRLRQVDVDSLVLDEIPALIEAHVVAYRIASQNPQLNRTASYFRTVYHTLNPHPALSPAPNLSDPKTTEEQQKRETIYRQLLAQGILAVLLPTEDLENDCLRTLVGDILADMILGELVGGKASEGPFIWEIITHLIMVIKKEGSYNEKVQHVQRSRLEKFGLLSMNEESASDDSSVANKSHSSVILWGFLQYCYLIYLAFRFTLAGLFRAASSSLPVASRKAPSSSPPPSPLNPACEAQYLTNRGSLQRPVLKYRLFGMVSQLVDVPKRMPWLGGVLALAQHAMVEGPGKIADTGEIVDRFLHETIQNHLLTPTILPVLLLAIRTTLFPLNSKPSLNTNISTASSSSADLTVPQAPVGTHSSSGSTQLPASLQTKLESQTSSKTQANPIRRSCAASILSLIPRRVALAIFCIPTTTAEKSRQTLKLESNNIANTSNRSSNRIPNVDTDIDLRLGSAYGPCKSGIDPSASQPTQSAPGSFRYSKTMSAPKANPNRENKNSVAHPHTQALGASLGEHEANDDQEELLLSAFERDILDLFADTYCNKHLMYSIIETVLVKLLPEISELGVTELMAERGV
ncbi:uncharacterized protein PADG_01423 [Paracoccidioides brasiliensis Pb18]|uniref:PXA domain-containing protein n=1 Tax=Paracoccidioides brasiliensis (strain Pb18) TaxID=502780 RepID=C1G3A7_PARBD|nr:uncharacterized protein PADG_01423 [Paracoccidioides brasiliensis Pb18]EEH45273.2 hypothetical protein PADG_01423 [Paracoccidioides brasiliensis Pb18]